jgi:predicted signal transduction protein with EAL and GGDEF domain
VFDELVVESADDAASNSQRYESQTGFDNRRRFLLACQLDVGFSRWGSPLNLGMIDVDFDIVNL